jgi:hypothetical protein
MLGTRMSSRACSALAPALTLALALAVAGCAGGSAATSRTPEGSGASLMTALAHVADTANNRSWIWYDDTAAIGPISGAGSSPGYQRKGFASLRGIGTGTSTLESAQAAKDTGIDIYNEGYSISAGTLPRELTLVDGGQNAQVVSTGLGALGWRDNRGTLQAPPLSDFMAPGGKSLAAASYRPILDQVKASGSDVKYGDSGTDLDEIGSPSGPTLAGDPLISALANCLGDVVAAEFNVHGSYYGQPVGRGPVEAAIGILRPASNAATPRTVVCAAWQSESAASRYAADVRKAIFSETSITGKQRYPTELTDSTVTVGGGGQHIVEWRADTPTGAATVFGMMQLYDLPALPSCTLARKAKADAIGCD